MAKHIKSLL